MLPFGCSLSSLRCPSCFSGSVRFPRCFAYAHIVQTISFPFRFLPVLSGTFLLSALSSLPPFQAPVARLSSCLIQPLSKFSLCPFEHNETYYTTLKLVCQLLFKKNYFFLNAHFFEPLSPFVSLVSFVKSKAYYTLEKIDMNYYSPLPY